MARATDNRRTTYAVASDLSGVVETTNGFGKYETRLEALEAQISQLEIERAKVAALLAEAKRLRRGERRRAGKASA